MVASISDLTMAKKAAIVCTIIFTSLFIFPFNFVFFPAINTKLIMAIASIGIFGVNLARRRSGEMDKDFFVLSFFALGVSLTTLFSVYYNNTRDYTYVTYIMSMMVWTGGAYTVISIMKWVHGWISVELVIRYLIAVCVMQCLLALAVNRIPLVDRFCSSFCLGFGNLKNYMDSGRLYAPGCAFDVAGMRFAAVLVMMGFCLPRVIRQFADRQRVIILYLLSFIIISVVGNMVARTTTLGLLFALICIVRSLGASAIRRNGEAGMLWKWTFYFIIGSIVIIVGFWTFDEAFRDDFRFAFEGFFSFFETGRFETNSTNILATMYRFPETLKTWMIGDGYFFNTSLDPYYTGVTYDEYYMATDVGYLRFIFYSGVVGLGAFVLFMSKAASICASKYREYSILFLLLLVLQFAIWFKVASDIYCVFALFIVIDSQLDSPLERNESRQ